jgi:hypothetical protein
MHKHVRELHYIVAIANIPSILEQGILSNEKVSRISHVSVARDEVQERRDKKRIPKGLPLHAYVNLYLNARNPMLYYLLRNALDDLCVLIIESSVIASPGVVIADRNASSDYVTFCSPSEAMQKLDFNRIYSRYWTHPDDPIEELIHKSIICAEVLVPHVVVAKYITGAYVASNNSRDHILREGFDREVVVKPDMFFNRQIRRRE